MFFCLAILYLSETPQVKKLLHFLGKDKQNTMCTYGNRRKLLYLLTQTLRKMTDKSSGAWQADDYLMSQEQFLLPSPNTNSISHVDLLESLS